MKAHHQDEIKFMNDKYNNLFESYETMKNEFNIEKYEKKKLKNEFEEINQQLMLERQEKEKEMDERKTQNELKNWWSKEKSKLEEENQNLNILLIEQSNKILNLQNNLNQEKQNQNIQNNSSKEIIEKLNHQNKKLQQKENLINEINKKNENLIESVKLLKNENFQINELLNMKENEINNMFKQTQEMKSLEKEFSNIKQKNDELNIKISKLENENKNLELLFEGKKTECQDLQKKISLNLNSAQPPNNVSEYQRINRFENSFSNMNKKEPQSIPKESHQTNILSNSNNTGLTQNQSNNNLSHNTPPLKVPYSPIRRIISKKKIDVSPNNSYFKLKSDNNSVSSYYNSANTLNSNKKSISSGLVRRIRLEDRNPLSSQRVYHRSQSPFSENNNLYFNQNNSSNQKIKNNQYSPKVSIIRKSSQHKFSNTNNNIGNNTVNQYNEDYYAVNNDHQKVFKVKDILENIQNNIDNKTFSEQKDQNRLDEDYYLNVSESNMNLSMSKDSNQEETFQFYKIETNDQNSYPTANKIKNFENQDCRNNHRYTEKMVSKNVVDAKIMNTFVNKDDFNHSNDFLHDDYENEEDEEDAYLYMNDKDTEKNFDIFKNNMVKDRSGYIDKNHKISHISSIHNHSLNNKDELQVSNYEQSLLKHLNNF